MPGPSGLLVCDSQSHSRSLGGLRRECTRSRSSSGEARGEQCRDRSHALALLAVRGLVDETTLTAPLLVLPPCVHSLVGADLGLWTAIGTARIALTPMVTASDHDGSILVPLAAADPHVSVPAPVLIMIVLGIACGLLTGLTSPRTARGLVRGIGGAGV